MEIPELKLIPIILSLLGCETCLLLHVELKNYFKLLGRTTIAITARAISFVLHDNVDRLVKASSATKFSQNTFADEKMVFSKRIIFAQNRSCI